MKRRFIAAILITAAVTAAVLGVRVSANEDLTKRNGTYYSSNGTEIPDVKARGIDISTHQGDIDWNALKSEYENGNIDFVIIRCGYGSDITSQDDKRWKRNVDECGKAGIPYGVYLYSYADTVDKARSELEHVKRLISGYAPAYPIFYDLEDSGTVGTLSADRFREIVDVFCGGLYRLGYETGVYSMRAWYENGTRIGGLDLDGMPWLVRWIAEFNPTLKYDKGFDIWQATSQGRVNGISGNVDIDYSFLPKRTASHCYVTFDINTDAKAECDLTPAHLNAGDRIGWLPQPVCATKRFLGWYTEPSGGTRVTEDTRIPAGGRLRLYAHWGSGSTPAQSVSGSAPAAPDVSSLSVIRPILSGQPFSINGLTNTMEYRIGGGAWTSGERIRAVYDGQTVEVRYRASGSRPAGRSAKVYIHTAATLSRVARRDPTCGSPGTRAHFVNSEGRVFASETDYIGESDTSKLAIPPTGNHTFTGEWRVRGDGHYRICAVCGAESSLYRHTAGNVEHAEPDCAEPGYDRTACADCGTVYLTVTIPPTGEHTYMYSCSETCLVCGNERETVHTFTGEWRRHGGVHYKVCVICGKEGERSPHTERTAEHTDPGCAEPGYDRTVCADCGMVCVSVRIPPTGHFFADGVCTVCGEADPEYALPAESESDNPADGTETDGKDDRTDVNAVGRAGIAAVAVSLSAAAASAVACIAGACASKKQKRSPK